MTRPSTVVQLDGEYDLSNAATLAAALLEHGADALMVADLRDVTFLDSTALSQLVRSHQVLNAGGGSLVLVVPSAGVVHRVLAVTKLDEVLTCRVSMEDALRVDDVLPGHQLPETAQ